MLSNNQIVGGAIDRALRVANTYKDFRSIWRAVPAAMISERGMVIADEMARRARSSADWRETALARIESGEWAKAAEALGISESLAKTCDDWIFLSEAWFMPEGEFLLSLYEEPMMGDRDKAIKLLRVACHRAETSIELLSCAIRLEALGLHSEAADCERMAESLEASNKSSDCGAWANRDLGAFDIFARAESLVDEGNVEGARQLLRIAQRRIQDHDSRLFAARLWVRLHEESAAQQCLEAALTEGGADALKNMQVARMAAELGCLDVCRSALRLAQDSESAKVYLDKASLYSEIGDSELAVLSLNTALDIVSKSESVPGQTVCWHASGTVSITEVEHIRLLVLEASAKSVSDWLDLAEECSGRGELAKAEVALEKAFDLSVNVSDLLQVASLARRVVSDTGGLASW